MPRRIDPDALYARATDLVRSAGDKKITILFLQKKLATSFKPAQSIHARLQREGVIGRNMRTNISQAPPQRTEETQFASELLASQQDLYTRAKELVLRERTASSRFLKEKLGVGDYRARFLLQRLRDEKIIVTERLRSTVIASATPTVPLRAQSASVGLPLAPLANGQPTNGDTPPVNLSLMLRLLVSALGKDKVQAALRQIRAEVEALEQVIA